MFLANPEAKREKPHISMKDIYYNWSEDALIWIKFITIFCKFTMKIKEIWTNFINTI